MNMPGLAAEASIYRSIRHYRAPGLFGRVTESVLGLIPQNARDDCLRGCGERFFWSPLAFGICALTCLRQPSAGEGLDPRNNPTDPFPSPERDPALNPQPSALTGASGVDLSSQIALLGAELKRQLNRIERCTCGLPPFIFDVPVSPYLPPQVLVPPEPVRPVLPFR
jgi:hypothetical protein